MNRQSSRDEMADRKEKSMAVLCLDREAFEKSITANLAVDVSRDRSGRPIVQGSMVAGGNFYSSGTRVIFESPNLSPRGSGDDWKHPHCGELSESERNLDGSIWVRLRHFNPRGAPGWVALGPVPGGPANAQAGALAITCAVPLMALGFSTFGLRQAQLQVFDMAGYMVRGCSLDRSRTLHRYVGVAPVKAFTRLVIVAEKADWVLWDVIGQVAG